jgi:hypothetical protein
MHRRASNPMVLEALMKLPLAGSCQCGKSATRLLRLRNWFTRAAIRFRPFCSAADIQA